MWAQLLHHSVSSVEQRTALKARLADLAYLYCDSTIDSCDFTMHEECFCAINSLRKNDNIIITKPHKGSGVVLLNKSDYVDKMNKILDDQSKFKRHGPVSSNDNTSSIESRLQKWLLDLVKADLIPDSRSGYMTQYDQLDGKDLFVCCLWLPFLFLGMEIRHERQFRFMPSTQLKLAKGKDGSPFRTSHE